MTIYHLTNQVLFVLGTICAGTKKRLSYAVPTLNKIPPCPLIFSLSHRVRCWLSIRVLSQSCVTLSGQKISELLPPFITQPIQKYLCLLCCQFCLRKHLQKCKNLKPKEHGERFMSSCKMHAKISPIMALKGPRKNRSH